MFDYIQMYTAPATARQSPMRGRALFRAGPSLGSARESVLLGLPPRGRFSGLAWTGSDRPGNLARVGRRAPFVLAVSRTFGVRLAGG